MPATVPCPACGRRNGSRGLFCRFCGGRMGERPAAHRRAIEAFCRGEQATAEREFRALAGEQPRSAEVRRQLGHALMHAGRRDEAKAAYLDARRLGDDSAETQLNLGVLHYHQGLMREAAAEFEAATHAPVSLVAGEFYLGLRFATDAHFRAECLMYLGSALKELGFVPEATSRLEQAVRLHPENLFAHGNLGDAYLAAQRFEDCAREYGTVLELAPRGMDLLNVHNDLGIVYYKQGRVEDAIRELKHVITRNPEYPNAIYNLGLIYAREGLTGKVMEDYKEFLNSGHAATIFLEMSRSFLNLGKAQAESPGDGGLVGDSDALRAVRHDIARAAVSDATVLVTGESGVGKELVARAVHRASPRADRPFVAMNCAAVADGLLESELFGHEKGAFTGAVARKTGKFEAADRGTIFLDEIGDLSLATQAKLLRVLQEKEVERVGGSGPFRVDVRVIAATNQDLKRLIAQSRFREDLFYRLNVIGISVPPLRERAEDISALAEHFLALNARRHHRRFRAFAPGAMAALRDHDWPGNVRELQHVVERVTVMFDGEDVQEEHLPVEIATRVTRNGVRAPERAISLKEMERELILSTLRRNGWRRGDAARSLGIDVTTLWRKMRRYGLRNAVELQNAPLD